MKLTLFPFVKEFIYEAYIVDNFCLNFIKAFEQEFYEDGGMLIRLVVSLFFFPPLHPVLTCSSYLLEGNY